MEATLALKKENACLKAENAELRCCFGLGKLQLTQIYAYF
jgi:hypothetical protein